MYIEPNTEIRILKNCPLDPTYDHTLWFNNRQEQYTYFSGLTKYRLQRQSYQRQSRGVMRVEVKAEDLFDCNYLMFRNIAFGTKVFYAFIKNVEYVNNITAEITYELDVMQTWLFDWSFDECFVIREHSETDEIGDNLIPEPVNCGTYVTGYPVTTEQFTNWKIVVITTGNIDSAIPGILPADGGFYAGVYGSCDYHIFPADSTGVQSVKTLLRNLSFWNNQDIVVGMYMIPQKFIPADPATMTTAIASKQDAYLRGGDFTVPFNAKGESSTQGVNFTLFGGYVPKNNKLYTYPYNFFVCENGQGESKEFMFEYFDKVIGPVFHLVSDYGLEPSVMCVPFGYMQKRQTGTELDINVSESLSISNFPKCTWATTDLGAKLVQGGMSLALLAATRGFSGIYTPPRPAPETNALATTSQELSTNVVKPKIHLWPNEVPADDSIRFGARLKPKDAVIAGYVGKSILNSHISSSIGRGNTMYVSNYFDFTFKQKFIDRPFAMSVDNFFTMYGYQTNRVKTPNRTSRPHWNYVRTANCTLKGSVPADDIQKICAIHDAGITYWKNGAEVGNYSLDNSPQ